MRGVAEIVARLDCGTELTYEMRSFAPDIGDRVPCRNHGYCEVSAAETAARARSQERRRLARPTTADLAAFMRTRRVASVGVLRQHRFTLRLVAAAQAEGLVDADLLNGWVEVRR